MKGACYDFKIVASHEVITNSRSHRRNEVGITVEVYPGEQTTFDEMRSESPWRYPGEQRDEVEMRFEWGAGDKRTKFKLDSLCRIYCMSMWACVCGCYSCLPWYIYLAGVFRTEATEPARTKVSVCGVGGGWVGPSCADGCDGWGRVVQK